MLTFKVRSLCTYQHPLWRAVAPVQICFFAAMRPQDAAKGLKLGFLTCKVVITPLAVMTIKRNNRQTAWRGISFFSLTLPPTAWQLPQFAPQGLEHQINFI